MLTDNGIYLIAENFKSLVTGVTYKCDGIQKTTTVARCTVSDGIVKFYILFDDEASGTITEISLVDKDNIAIVTSDESYTKAADKSLFVTFKYAITEAKEE